MKIMISEQDFQFKELLYNTLRQLSNIDRYVSNAEFRDLKGYYAYCKGVIKIYDDTIIDDALGVEGLTFTSGEYKELLSYATIYKSIDCIVLKDKEIGSYRLYHALVIDLLERYDYLENEKAKKKERNKEFLINSENNLKLEETLKAYEEAIANYGDFVKEAETVFSNDSKWVEIKTKHIKKITES